MEHCKINIIQKGAENPKISESTPLQIFGRHDLIKVPQKERQVLKDIIKEYLQTIGEHEFQAQQTEPESTFTPFSLDVLLTSIISRRKAAAKGTTQDQLVMMTLYELLQNQVLMNQTYTMCVKDDGAASNDGKEESKD